MTGRGGGEDRVPSSRWKGIAVVTALAGTVAAAVAAAAIEEIDPATAAPTSTAQDVVGVTAVIIAVAGAGASLVWAVRMWRRPAAALTRSGLRVYNWRPLLVPWPMISAVCTAETRSGMIPALVLADRQVLPLRYAPPLTPQPASASGQLIGGQAALRVIRTALHDQRGGGPEEGDCPPPDARKAVRGSLRCRCLPEGSAAAIRRQPTRWLWFMMPVLLLAALGGSLKEAQRGHTFNTAQFLLAAGAIICLGEAAGFVLWTSLTRKVVVGPGWIAWKPRLRWFWQVLRVEDVVSVSSGRRLGDQAVAIKRADGRGIDVSQAELRSGAAAPLADVLDSHRGLTDEASGMLASAARTTR